MLTVSHNNITTGYNDYPTLYSTANLFEDDFFRKNIKTNYGTRPTTTAKYSRANFNESRGMSSGLHRINTAGRPGTGALSRPMTAVRGVGYTSASRRSAGSNGSFEFEKEETPEQKIKEFERKIFTLLDESVMAAHVKNTKIALKRAEEASSQERSLNIFEDRIESNDRNMSLNFAVIFNLAQQFENQQMYQEALTEYRRIANNKNFRDTARLKVNIGNIYVKMGNLTEAVKMYQIAFDQTPLIHKYIRRKIVHNIGILLIQMGRVDEAAQKFKWIMKEKPDLESGMHLILCYFALSHVDGMKRGFFELLDVPLPINIDDEYSIITDDIAVNIFNDTIKNDELSKFEHELKTRAEKTILNAANLIAPVIEDTLAQGFTWCAEAIKSSAYSSLATNLEINKAMVHLHNGQVQTAIKSLKDFEREDLNNNSSASTVLSFINFLRKDYAAAEKYAEIAKNMNKSNAAAYVNLSACSIVKNELIGAENLLLSALKHDPNNVQCLYNLGLLYKKKNVLDEAFECFFKLTQITQNDPLTFYQLGHICQLRGDTEQANKWYNQLLALKLLDPGVFKKLGEMYNSISDKQQAYHYYAESYRAYPADFEVIHWLYSYCISMKNFSGAMEYSLKGVELTPGQSEWRLLFANCLKKSGDIHEALAEYRDINQKFPENINCLKSLYELERSLGSKDAKKYSNELKRLLQFQNKGDEVDFKKTSLSRGNSRISSISRMSAASGKRLDHGLNEDTYSTYSVSRSNSTHFIMEPKFYDTSYDGSYEDIPTRPMTAAGKRDDDFGDDELGEHMLPE